MPLSPGARDAGHAWLETCLTGGDDYELLMAVQPQEVPALAAHAARLGIQVSRIGAFVQDQGVRVLDAAGLPLRLARTGWSHF